MHFQTDSTWSPSDYRAALAHWREQASPRDSDIMPALRSTEKPKLGALAPACRPLLSRRSEPSGEALQSNWRVEPGDALNPEDLSGMRSDASREITPSRAEILRQARTVQYRELANGERYPESGDFDFGETVDDRGRRHRVITRIGGLHFSDGTQTEVGFTIGPDGSAIHCRFRMETGAMLGTRERVGRAKGRAGAGTSNARLAAVFGVPMREHVPSSRTKKRRTENSTFWTRQELEAAIASWSGSVTRYPPGLPMANAEVGDIFVSLQKRKTGSGGAATWQDQFTSALEKYAYRAAWAELTDRDRIVIDTALEAGTLADVGAAIGHTGDYARKSGKRALVAANDNLAQAVRKIAA